MMKSIREDALAIVEASIKAVMPGNAVREALASWQGPAHVIAIGKAAWEMASAAVESITDLRGGLVITKYHHARGPIEGLEIMEAAHPVPDENTLRAAERAVAYARTLGPEDTLLFLVSGGGSALFELPLEGVTLEEIAAINQALLESGADISEMNTLRKHLSRVKGGRFAALCGGAKIHNILLSDVLGDRLDVIASGPTVPDASTSEEALAVVARYGIPLTQAQKQCLARETPKTLPGVDNRVIGSVRRLCEAAAAAAEALGYRPYLLTDVLSCEAREAGRMLASMAQSLHSGVSAFGRPAAVIMGGETVVRITGKGKGGRNQELALAAAEGIAGLPDTLVFSLGSDGTDGPTDAAGGIVTNTTAEALRSAGFSIPAVLAENDSYTALDAAEGLLRTGPTGTNVNDISVLLCR